MNRRQMAKHEARARVIKAMAHPARLIILDELAEHGERCVYEGPRGGPGMQEMLAPTSAIKGVGLDDRVALITDGRFSGGTAGESLDRSRTPLHKRLSRQVRSPGHQCGYRRGTAVALTGLRPGSVFEGGGILLPSCLGRQEQQKDNERLTAVGARRQVGQYLKMLQKVDIEEIVRVIADAQSRREPKDEPERKKRGSGDTPAPVPTVCSEDLLQGGRQLEIVHGGEVYRLVLTRNNKLILQK